MRPSYLSRCSANGVPFGRRLTRQAPETLCDSRRSAEFYRKAQSPLNCSSIAGVSESREKLRMRGKSARYEFGEKPYALRLARLAMHEDPKRSEQAQRRARCPHERRVGVCDKARQQRHSEPQSYREDVCRGVGGPKRNVRGWNVAFARPIRHSLLCPDDPADTIGCASASAGRGTYRRRRITPGPSGRANSEGECCGRRRRGSRRRFIGWPGSRDGRQTVFPSRSRGEGARTRQNPA